MLHGTSFQPFSVFNNIIGFYTKLTTGLYILVVLPQGPGYGICVRNTTYTALIGILRFSNMLKSTVIMSCIAYVFRCVPIILSISLHYWTLQCVCTSTVFIVCFQTLANLVILKCLNILIIASIAGIPPNIICQWIDDLSG